MPLFTSELNRLADVIKASNLTLYLNTAAPSDSDTDNGRVTTGGGTFASGATITPANIGRDTDGDLTITVAVNFGTSNAALGTITHWSLFRGTEGVAFDTLPSTVVQNGDSFTINANVLKINGTTSSAA